MNLKALIKKSLTGITIPREYCCIKLEEITNALSIRFIEGDFTVDVTHSHILLGYKPLIIGLTLPIKGLAYEILKARKVIDLQFVAVDPAPSRSKSYPETTVARLQLSRIEERLLNTHVIILYQGIYGKHSFLSPFQQLVNKQREKFQTRAADNIGLPGNLLDQVQIAYAIPRKISVITTGNGSLFNMFPTDLHGHVNEVNYISSLRIGGKATQQVEAYKNVVLSDVGAAYYKETYALGKNHMMPLRAEGELEHSNIRSEQLGFILPKSAIQYSELKLCDSFDFGIHRIHFYNVMSRRQLVKQTETLGHIHRVFAEWRKSNGFSDELFF